MHLPWHPGALAAAFSMRMAMTGLLARCRRPPAPPLAADERRDEGFLLLGSYMSGNNAGEARCRETQPVVMCYPPQARHWRLL